MPTLLGLPAWARRLVVCARGEVFQSAVPTLQHFLQLDQERVLVGDELLACRGEIKPGGAIDFRKLLAPAGTRRPFDLECVADQFRRIEIAAAGKRVHGLAAGLSDRGKSNKRSLGREAGLFCELAL